jgi:hypothetical protein
MFMKELRGDDIVAVDGRIGVLDDLYIDDERWIVRYVAVHTGSWLCGRRLLLPAQLVGTPAPGGDAILVALRRKDAHNSPGVGAATAHYCSASELLGHGVVGYDGACGRIDDLVVDESRWSVPGIVVAAGSRFESRKFLVRPGAVEQIDREQRLVRVALTREQIGRVPVGG